VTASDGTPRYFAVPDPDTGDMTYWFRNAKDAIVAWPLRPRQAVYGPTLWTRPGPGRDHIIPDGLRVADRQAWIRNWATTVRIPWMGHILHAIDVDTVGSAARFAAFRSTCFICGLPLEDDDSKVWGVGPVCRPRVPVAFLEAAAREIGRAHAQLLRQT
jgi:hypothetical protein